MANSDEGQKRANEKWCRAGVPRSGWTCVSTMDLGENPSTCEMCEREEIRYVHFMTHADYVGQLACGAICAGHMEKGVAQAQLRAKRLRNVAARRARWLRRRWQSAASTAYLHVDGCTIMIRPSGDRWLGTLISPARSETHIGAHEYKTSEAAQLAMFDALILITNGHGERLIQEDQPLGNSSGTDP